MYPLNLPSADIKIIDEDGKLKILDSLRRKYVILTPEEWVRQNFTHYLINHRNYPTSLIANEVSIELNGMSRRCDSIVYAKNMKAKVIIEYKASTIVLNQSVFQQISRYNLVLKVDYLIVSNGIKHYCCKMDYENNTYNFLTDIPYFNSL